jgi:hypothetical protein
VPAGSHYYIRLGSLVVPGSTSLHARRASLLGKIQNQFLMLSNSDAKHYKEAPRCTTSSRKLLPPESI